MSVSPAPASRRTVTVLFCDVVDSTPLGERLDPEALRRVFGGYFEAVQEVLERHGGTVEKFIGDAVMSVFGIPTLHEDDAVRAVRAASELAGAVAPIDRALERDYGVRLRVRVGVATGEVVAGDPAAGQAFATGETVVTAQRLEQATRPDEVLIDAATYRLVADAVDVEPVGRMEVKGKAEPVEAWRLLGVQPGAPGVARRFDTALVGRDRELAVLRYEFERAVADRRCRLVTVLGPAGIGKSRLVREFVLATGPQATVRVGRCPPYGEGITFWPIAEVLPDEMLEGTTDEIFWRVRKQFEELARERPLILGFDDVHWAEPTLLNLVEYLKGWIVDAPVLLVCLARPELADHRPEWMASAVIMLDPLSQSETERLLGSLAAPAQARARIARAAEGNPLFVEQMAAMAADAGADFEVPPSIRSLLAARLDLLSPGERAVVERAAVIGREFPLRAVASLAPEDVRPEVANHLLTVVRKDLVEPASWTFGDEDAFRFRHGLIQDAAYEGIPKALRADLHEHYARWFERYSGEDVIVGYHLERAFRFRRELGRGDDETLALAREAGGLLGEAGRRAFARADMPAARTVLRRAVSLLPAAEVRHRELARLLANVLWMHGEIEQADAMLRDIAEAAATAGDRGIEVSARLDLAARRSLAGLGDLDELVSVAEEAIRVFEELDEDPGLIKARRALGTVAIRRGQYGRAEAELERALIHARRAGDGIEEARCADVLCTALLYGPGEAGDAAERCRSLLEGMRGNLFLEANVSSSLAGLVAMQGGFAEARSLYGRAREIFLDLGLRMPLAGLTQISGAVELLAGEPEAAERELREGYEILEAAGATGLVAPQAALLSEALLLQERVDGAAGLVAVAQARLTGEDLSSQILVLTMQAKLALQERKGSEALATAEQAVALGIRTDALNFTGDALVALAVAQRQVGHREGAASSLEAALELYTRKGNVAAAQRAQVQLAEPVA